MNIFVLDKNPTTAAEYMCDKHIVKMILESCQLLSTAHRVLDGKKVERQTKNGRRYTYYMLEDSRVDSYIYKSTMINHPCTIWTRQSTRNYDWLCKHTLALCEQYTKRYGKTHVSTQLAEWLFRHPPTGLKIDSLTPFAQAMPDQYKHQDAIKAYRDYYIFEKSRFAKWKLGNTPEWYLEGLKENSLLNSKEETINGATV
jgi:hypothetical protein